MAPPDKPGAAEPPLSDQLAAAAEMAGQGDAQAAADRWLRLVERLDDWPDAETPALLEAMLTAAEHLLQRGERPAGLTLLNVAARQLHARCDFARLFRALLGMTQAYVALSQFDTALPYALACARLLPPQGTGQAGAVPLSEHAPLQAMVAVGVCHGLMGDYPAAERYMLQALESASQDRVDAVQRMCVINLVFLSGCAADRLQRAGKRTQALSVLWQAARHVTQGEQLDFVAGSHNHATWRANRAGWLRRVGRLDDARPEYEWAYNRAASNAWLDVVRHAALGLAQITIEQRNPGLALPWLVRCIAASESLDAYGFVTEAHTLLAGILKAQGDRAAATRHQAHAARLLDALHAERRRVQDSLASIESDRRLAIDTVDRQTPGRGIS